MSPPGYAGESRDSRGGRAGIRGRSGLGLHFGIDLVRDPTTKERAIEEAEAVMFKCMERGLAFKTIEGSVITLRPALIITWEEMKRALDILEEAIGEVETEQGY